MSILFAALLMSGYLVAPIALVWGWSDWIKQRPRIWTVQSSLSFIGFLLASASAIFALGMIAYAASGGFEQVHNALNHPTNYVFFYRWLRFGIVLSLLGLLSGIGGAWQRGPLRWQTPVTALGTLAFWLIATTWP